MSKLICSFCGKPIEEETQCFVGNGGVICKECAELLGKTVAGITPKIQIKKSLSDVPKPKEIRAFLDQYIIGQEEAKEKISVAVYNHYKRVWGDKNGDDVEILKSNCIMVGPTGVGKTEVARTIAKMLDVPFCIADATTVTQAGYVGDDIETILTRLLQAADYDVARAEQGIVFIDEIDKIARKQGANASITRDVTGEGVQQGLLKLLEGSVVNVPPQGGRKHPDAKMVQMDTTNILFICGGAFAGIERVVENRMNVHTIGFATAAETPNKKPFDKKNAIKYVLAEDLRSYGLIPELIGRLPVIVHFTDLNKDALKKILTEPKNSIVKQYKKLFEIDGVSLTFDDDAYEYIVDKATENKLGARGLRSILEIIMTKAMYNVPSDNVSEFNVSLEYAKNIYENEQFEYNADETVDSEAA